jgi:FKBP-type peptidyl-prolyl cis-trans isomerase FkpA
MTYKYNIFFICALMLSIIACSNDDDDTPVSVPENDRTEQQVVDNDSLVNYLNTHYYNATEVNAISNPTVADVVITELLEGETLPSGTALLMSAVETKTTTYLDVEYDYYILKIKQGSGATSPRFCDKVRVNYSGYLMDGTKFDGSSLPVNFDLVSLIPGWSRVMPQFNTANSYVSNSDGTVSFDGYGMGVMFLPSGLGYFATFRVSIPSYSNLIFKFELMQTQTADHDFDNIPTYIEAIEGDLNLYNKDLDGDLLADFIDTDDDGDGMLTSDEVRVETYTEDSRSLLETTLNALELESNQFLSPIKFQPNQNDYTANRVTILDSNGNGVPNYLDDTESDRIE